MHYTTATDNAVQKHSIKICLARKTERQGFWQGQREEAVCVIPQTTDNAARSLVLQFWKVAVEVAL
jgi:hypothetical protein